MATSIEAYVLNSLGANERIRERYNITMNTKWSESLYEIRLCSLSIIKISTFEIVMQCNESPHNMIIASNK